VTVSHLQILPPTNLPDLEQTVDADNKEFIKLVCNGKYSLYTDMYTHEVTTVLYLTLLEL